MRVWLVFILAMAVAFRASLPQALAKPAGPEIRAAWLPLGNFSKDEAKGRAEAKACVDRLANAHFNTLYVWVTSEYMVALHNERYRSLTQLAEWDGVGAAIRAAADRGMECHVWYSFTYYKSPTSPEFDPQEGGDPAWISVAKYNHPDRSALTRPSSSDSRPP